MFRQKQFKGIVFLILGRWRQSNAQDATVENLLKSSGLIDRGKPWRNCIKCREKRKDYKKTKVVDKKSEVDEVFDHVWQLLMNDLFLEKYFMIFGKHKDRVIIEIPVDDKPKQTS